MEITTLSELFLLISLAAISVASSVTSASSIDRSQKSSADDGLSSVANSGSTNFPGVSRDVLPFCSSRPSLPISLAMMVVHVKKDVSFNYKLYLLSDKYVFQTGQVIPRDDFKIHAFPAKVKRISEFWPNYPRSFMQPITTTTATTKTTSSSNSAIISAESGAPSDIDFSPPVTGAQLDTNGGAKQSSKLPLAEALTTGSNSQHGTGPKGAIGQILPVASFSSFDTNTTYLVRKDFGQEIPHILKLNIDAHQFKVIGYVNVSDQDHPSGLLVESDLLHWDDEDGNDDHSSDDAHHIGVHHKGSHRRNHQQQLRSINRDDYDFLSHPILADTNTRIMAITQIYEDWITRNYYTIVYVQRRMSMAGVPPKSLLNSSSSFANNEGELNGDQDDNGLAIIYDRLIFRGASTLLVAADQMDYPIEAAAFITEKNRLHYWLEFLSHGENRFQLKAIEWSTKPFKIHSGFTGAQPNSQLLDNEELILCPPSVCYSYQPVDEIVDYGYISLPTLPTDEIASNQSQGQPPSRSKSSSSSSYSPSTSLAASDLAIYDNLNGGDNNNNDLHAALDPEDAIVARVLSNATWLAGGAGGESLARYRRFFNNYLSPSNRTTIKTRRDNGRASAPTNSLGFDPDEYLKQLKLETKLHLRDWLWPLHPIDQVETEGKKFQLRYDEGLRTPIKAITDNYGYIITGHKVDASFRVFNEIYLITANLLITINYTQSNESVVTKSSLNSEYPGLNSTIDDPITAAYYDRYENQVFFVKGDRYSGYDFANKSRLARFQDGQTAPVVDLIGHQGHIDAIYHNMQTDVVYIFSGMRYYTYKAQDFSLGFFNSAVLSEAKCINSNLLNGCQFDKAYKNPCQDHQETDHDPLSTSDNNFPITSNKGSSTKDPSTSEEFYLIQQQKVRKRRT